MTTAEKLARSADYRSILARSTTTIDITITAIAYGGITYHDHHAIQRAIDEALAKVPFIGRRFTVDIEARR